MEQKRGVNVDHISEAQSKLKPCQCGCTSVSIRPWYMDTSLKLGQMYACCNYCHKRTRTMVNPFDAMMDWNSDRVYDKDKVYKKPYIYEKYKGFVI